MNPLLGCLQKLNRCPDGRRKGLNPLKCLSCDDELLLRLGNIWHRIRQSLAASLRRLCLPESLAFDAFEFSKRCRRGAINRTDLLARQSLRKFASQRNGVSGPLAQRGHRVAFQKRLKFVPLAQRVIAFGGRRSASCLPKLKRRDQLLRRARARAACLEGGRTDRQLSIGSSLSASACLASAASRAA